MSTQVCAPHPAPKAVTARDSFSERRLRPLPFAALVALSWPCAMSGCLSPQAGGRGQDVVDSGASASGGRGSGGAAATAGATGQGTGGHAAGEGGMAGGLGGHGAGGSGASGGGAGSGGRNGGAGASGNAGTMGEGGNRGTAGRPASNGGAGAGGTAGDRCDVGNVDPTVPPTTLTLSGNLGTHDPVIWQAGNTFHAFQTGRGIATKTSANLTAWQGGSAVFASNPAWIATQVPGATDLWAPDISFFNGVYHLYYSASTFGSNRSCIGHATKAALASGAWTDGGAPTICSNGDGSNRDDWNAIDPNVALDVEGNPWLAFGSFWTGIKMIRLTAAGDRADARLYALANRPANSGALEAPFIVRRCGFYYLFVSFDRCCQGVDSTYKIAVGRSESITGPYVDKAGKPMLEGGGTILLEGNSRWRGPGHNAVIFVGSRAYNVYHAYDANADGAPTLRISELVWDAQGWPISAGP